MYWRLTGRISAGQPYNFSVRRKCRLTTNFTRIVYLTCYFHRSSLDSFGRFVGRAAHLKIGPNATRTQLPTSTRFEDYVADNHRDWFSHLEACGLDCDPSELVCISGFIKGSNLDLRTLARTPFNGYDCPSDHQSYTSWADTTLNLAGFIEFYKVRYRLPREDLDQISEPEDIDFISGLDTRPVRPIQPDTITGPLIITVGKNTLG